MRILITGSRDWPDPEAVHAAIGQFADGGEMVLVHGACPTGADAHVDQLGWIHNVSVERHPAEWRRHDENCPEWHHRQQPWRNCQRAGYRRNAEMVALGADVCLAFIRNNSKGATMTADLAEKAGIPTYRYTLPS